MVLIRTPGRQKSTEKNTDGGNYRVRFFLANIWSQRAPATDRTNNIFSENALGLDRFSGMEVFKPIILDLLVNKTCIHCYYLVSS